MASHSTIVSLLARASPPGGFGKKKEVQTYSILLHHRWRQGQQRRRARRTDCWFCSENLTPSSMFRSNLESRRIGLGKALDSSSTRGKNHGERLQMLSALCNQRIGRTQPEWISVSSSELENSEEILKCSRHGGLRRIICTQTNGSPVRGNNVVVAYSGRGKIGAGNEGTGVTNVAQQMRLLLESDLLAAQAANSLVGSISPRGRAALLSALFPDSTHDSAVHFAQADVNSDGVLDATEFANYVEAHAHLYGHSNKPLTSHQLFHLSTRAAIGMIGFGFTDNAIMILAGDAIQNTIGLTLGLSTLMSAGLGNAVADLVGTAFRGYIERITGKFMPEVQISSSQLESREAWWAETVGASAGVTVGCLLGLAPLVFLRQSDATATPTNEILAAGRNVDGSSSQTHEDIVLSHIPTTVRSGMETTFASVSTAVVPCQGQGRGMAQKVGSSMFILTIIVALAAKRVHQFLRNRQKKLIRPVVKQD